MLLELIELIVEVDDEVLDADILELLVDEIELDE